MHERDLEAEHAVPRPLVDQLDALLGEVSERRLEVGDLVSDVVHALAALREEPADGRVVAERGEQLDAALADPHRGSLDSLVLDPLAVLEASSEEALVRGHRGVQVGNGDADVMNGPCLHRGDATPPCAMLAAMACRLVLGLLVVVAVAGCGGGSSSNGEAKKTAAQVVTDAKNAALAATIVHVTGQGTDNGAPLKIDLWIGDRKGKGHLEEDGVAFDVVRLGDTTYIKGGSAFLTKFANPAAAALLHDKWLKAPATTGRLAAVASLTDKRQFFSGVLGQHGKVENKGETDYKGQKAVEIRDTTQGGSLFVAATGTPYPVALAGGKQQGDIRFSDWNGSETIEAPKGAVDLSSLGK
jgi:hypothetical protein